MSENVDVTIEEMAHVVLEADAYEAAMVERYGQEAWDAFVAHDEEMAERAERECGVSISMGPAHDLYGTSCELDRGHEGPHEGPHPIAEDRSLRWTGGGSVAGDALPFHITTEADR